MAFKNIMTILSFVTLASADDFQMPDFSKGGGFGGGGRASSCPAHKCSKGYEAAPARSQRPVASGCSGIGGGMVMSMGGDEGPLEQCCSKRTACFQTCGSSKKQCEKMFETCNKDTCGAIVDEEERKKCDSSANLQQMLANMNSDCREFSTAQSNACQCLTPEKAVARREKTLKDLYKKYSPDQISKVDGLLAKAGDDVKKFAALLNKFIAKFPEVIRIKKTDQQNMYENIMKEAKEGKDTTKDTQEDTPEDTYYEDGIGYGDSLPVDLNELEKEEDVDSDGSPSIYDQDPSIKREKGSRAKHEALKKEKKDKEDKKNKKKNPRNSQSSDSQIENDMMDLDNILKSEL